MSAPTAHPAPDTAPTASSAADPAADAPSLRTLARLVRLGALVVLLVLVLLSSGCSLIDAAAGRDADARRGPKPGTVVRTTLLAAVKKLPVADEQRTGYDRDLFKHWTDVDANGCDTREEMLAWQNRSPDARMAPGCYVVNGSWFSYYDQRTHTSATGVEIDHLVPLAEAWDSGAHSWSATRRAAFANDLGDRRSLIAVTASQNQSKSDSDPTEWTPAYGTCVYVSSWVAVKTRWNMSVDRAEKTKLRQLAAGCGKRRLTVRIAKVVGADVDQARTADARASDTGNIPPTTTTSTPTSTPTTGPTSGPAGTDPRFGTCTEAVAHGYGPYVRGRDTEYAWYRDGDSDGTVCES